MYLKFYLAISVLLNIYLLFRNKHRHCADSHPSAQIVFYDEDGEEIDDMQLIKDDAKYKINVGGLDSKGNPADLDLTALTLSVSDDSMGAITPNGDGSFDFIPSGKLGNVSVQAQDGALTAIADLQVIAGAAVSLSIGLTEDVPAAPVATS